MANSSPSRHSAPLVTFHRGSAETEAEFFLHAYQDLRRLAQSYLKRERPDHTLQATALVHEVYLRLAAEGEIGGREKSDFMLVAARLMRRILIDHARKTKAAKRNGNGPAIPIEEAASCLSQNPDPIALNDALQALEKLHPRAARIVELRFFAGLTEEETARVLGISVTTVKREWAFARAWLLDLLS
jgi:RNA polymerase sigma factor (TIGR02999 family)